jgi:hypothetical protein
MEAHVGLSGRAPAATAAQIIRALFAFAFAAAMAQGLAGPASGADTLAVVGVSPGSLGFSPAPASVSLGVVDPGAVAAIALTAITVTDTRAGTAGWSASVVLTDFTGDATGAALSSAGSTYTPTAATTDGTVTVTASTATDPTMPRIVQTATGVAGNNTSTWNAGLSVPVPYDTAVDTYTATLTYSVS